MTLSIIIVTWNSQEFIKPCIESVLRSTRSISREIIIVDNHSDDKTIDRIHKYKRIFLFPQKKNQGFGKANNIGIQHAKGTFLLFLNPDTIVNTPAITSLIDFLKSTPDAGIAGPEQQKGNGKIMFTSTKLTVRGIVEYLIEKIVNIGQHVERKIFIRPQKTWMVNAGCLLARRNIFKTSHWFDQNLFMYGEELDLYDKLKQTSRHAYFLPYCSIIHYRDKSIDQTNKRWVFGMKSFVYVCARIIRTYIHA